MKHERKERREKREASGLKCQLENKRHERERNDNEVDNEETGITLSKNKRILTT